MAYGRESASSETGMREELAQLRADIDGLISTVSRLAKSARHEVMGSAKHAMGDARARAGETLDAAVAEGRRTLKSSEKAIRGHPYLSIAIAAGIGLVLGKLLSSRD